MNILAHRGWWHDRGERNSPHAIARALEAGFGIEVDLRDLAGTVVISHDPPLGGEQPFQALVESATRNRWRGPFALNIKSDGLQALLSPHLAVLDNYFLFDMAVPDLVASVRRGFHCYTRMSDVEDSPVLLADVGGVWLDSFEQSAPDLLRASALLAQGKRVAMVSPELHGRSHEDFWAEIRARELHRSPLAQICTDFPDQAAAYFELGV